METLPIACATRGLGCRSTAHRMLSSIARLALLVGRRDDDDGVHISKCELGERWTDIMPRSRHFGTDNWLCSRVPWVMVAGAVGVPWE